MSEREKNTLQSITKKVPKLDAFSRGFLSGYIAAKEEQPESKKEAAEEKTAEKKGE